MSINHYHAIGRLTRNPELKEIKDDQSVATFAIAINEQSKNGEKRTTFIDVECWNKQAVAVKKHLCKGSKVFLQGRLKQDCWESKNSKRSRHLIVAQRVEFLENPASFDPEELEND